MNQISEKENTIDSLRSALLNWYPFTRGERALLIGYDTEVIKEILERYYNHVDIKADLQTKYDCIVVEGIVKAREDVPAMLSELNRLLKNDGLFLLFFQNRFGIKYLCGGLDEYVKTPFYNLGPSNNVSGLYARNEMIELITGAGFSVPRYYYLMPDSSFVQAVYSDEYLPDDSIRDRVMPFDLYDSPLIAWEGDLYDDAVRERTLPFVANVYLAECRKPGAREPEKHVIYAALSTDRGKEHGFATVLYSDGSALKAPLFHEGRKALEKLYSNVETLCSKGVLTVPQRLSSAGIEMPVIREESLLHYMRRQLDGDPDAFLKIFSIIEEDLIRSSDIRKETPINLRSIWGASAEELGPVLETGFIDMIPYNAFWSDGRIRYYDQEFTVENCPIKYILFRAVFYTWIHIPEAENCFSLESVKELFGLKELWDAFYQHEMAFVADNRNKEKLAEIYVNNYPDRKRIEARRKELKPSADLKEVHAVQLELLKELKRVCDEHGLRYMAVHGTLLGAIRHRGFIPWDEDVDIAMPRSDYDRLVSMADYGFASGFFLQTIRNNFNCYYGGYSKLRRDGTAAYEVQNEGKPWNSCHQGIWIDIFPIDGCPAEEKKRKKLQNRISFLQRIVYAKVYPVKHFVPEDVPGDQISIYYLLAKCTRRRWIFGLIDTLCRSNNSSPLRSVLACYYGAWNNRNVWPAAAVETTVNVPFEDICIPVPSGWDTILRSRYGDDYMTPVPRKNKKGNVVFYINLDKD